MHRRITIARRLRTIVLACIALALAACAGVPTVSAIHSPLYRAENHTSTITVNAREPQDGIAEIRINAVVGELTACGGSLFSLPSVIPCRSRASSTDVVCTFANVKTQVTCALPINITPQRLITYSATARSGGNRNATSGPVTYAGGAPLTQVRLSFPLGNVTVPFETARPVIWRTDQPSDSTDRAGKVDLGFVPDADMPTYRAFTDDMQPIVMQLFYTDTNQFSTWNRAWKNLFNIWAGPAGGDGEGCTRTFASPAASVRVAFDGTAILHRNAFRDCADLALGGGAGTAQTNLGDATWVLVHETGHFLFGLGDEYVGGGNYAISDPKNVFASQSDCQSASTTFGLPTSQCVQIGTTGTWRNDDGQATTMEDRVLDSDWRTLSGHAMAKRVVACTGGTCY